MRLTARQAVNHLLVEAWDDRPSIEWRRAAGVPIHGGIAAWEREVKLRLAELDATDDRLRDGMLRPD